MSALKARVSTGFAECLQTMKKLAPIFPMPPDHRLDQINLPQHIVADDKYVLWERSVRSTAILLTGNPRSGKENPFRLLFEHSFTHTNSTYFSFDRSDARCDSTAAFLMSFIHQFLMMLPETFPKIEDACQRTVQSGRCTVYDLLILCRALIRAVEGMTLNIFIDHIDECRDLSALISMLKSLANSKNPTVKLLFTSSSTEAVLEAFKDVPTIALDPKVNDDFKVFLEGQVAEIGSERPILQEFSGDILDRLSSCSDFLQTSLFLDQLREAKMLSSPKEIRSQIQRIEYNLEKFIDSALNEGVPEWAGTALCFMAYAARPLNASELAVANALSTDFISLDGLGEYLHRDIFADLHRIFGPLIKLHNGEIRFVHRLAQEIAVRKISELPLYGSSYEYRITKLCVDYLCTKEVRDPKYVLLLRRNF